MQDIMYACGYFKEVHLIDITLFRDFVRGLKGLNSVAYIHLNIRSYLQVTRW